ncbi:MAG: sodium-dependent transporter [Massiliimalia sp.]
MKTAVSASKRGWTGSFGFVMAAAGAAVGMGNIWRFPMMVGENGGGAFVFVYLVCVCLIGIPMLIAEIAIGKHGRQNAFGSYQAVSKKWGGVGLLAIITSLIGLAYYTVLGGWLVRYLILSVQGMGAAPAEEFFQGFTASAPEQIGFYLFYMLITALIVAKGIKKGIEKSCKILMPILFVCLLVIAVRSCTLPGAGEGISFFLKPDFSKITPSVWIMALGQVFFSLSIGAGAGTTYGSYLNKKENIAKDAVMIAGFDTLAALLAGFAVLPAVFAAGKSPAMGPSLMFIVLPEVFASMPAGKLFAFLFFLLVLFASITTTIAFLEVIVAFVEQYFQCSRKKATALCAVLATVIGIPCALSFGVWSGVQLFGKGLFDLADYCVSNLMLPISAICTCIFIGWVWKTGNAVKEITDDGQIVFPLAKLWGGWIQFVLPVVIFLILLSSIGIF